MLRSISIIDAHTLNNMIEMTVAPIHINLMLFAHIICNMSILALFVILERVNYEKHP